MTAKVFVERKLFYNIWKYSEHTFIISNYIPVAEWACEPVY